MENWRHYADGQRVSFTRIQWSWLVVVCAAPIIPTCVCAHRIAAAGGIRREHVHSTINQSRVPLVHGEQQEKLHLSQALGTRHDRSTTYMGVYGDRGSNAPRSSPIGCNVAWHSASLFTSESISCIDGEGAMGRFATPRAPREQHRRDTANHRCAWVQVREEEYLLWVSSSNRGLRPEGDKACGTQTPSSTEQHRAAPSSTEQHRAAPSSTEQQERGGGRGKKKKGASTAPCSSQHSLGGTRSFTCRAAVPWRLRPK